MAENDLKILIENASSGFDEVTAAQASATEIDTGTAVNRVVTPAGLAAAEIKGIHVGTSAPSQTNRLWLDTN